MVRWMRWHCPPDTGFEIRSLTVWGRARYLSVTEAPHNTDLHTWMGKKHFCFFQTAEIGNRTPNSGVKGSGASHYPRAPALVIVRIVQTSYCDYPPRLLTWLCADEELPPTTCEAWSVMNRSFTEQKCQKEIIYH